MVISITKSEIYAHVVALTSRIGKNAEYAVLAASADNEALLNLYLVAAISEAEAKLKNKLSDSASLGLADNSTAVTISIKDKKGMSAAASGVFSTNFKLFVSHYVISQWLLSANSELWKVYGESCSGFLDSAIDAVDMRDAFIVTDYTNKSIDEEITVYDSESSSYARREDDGDESLTLNATETSYTRREDDGDESLRLDASGPGYVRRESDFDESLTLNATETSYTRREDDGDESLKLDAAGSSYQRREDDTKLVRGRHCSRKHIAFTNKLFDYERKNDYDCFEETADC